MSLTKLSLILSVLVMSSVQASSVVVCEVKTNNAYEKQSLELTIGNSSHGESAHFSTEDFFGFVASSKGYTVASITLKETNQTSTIHGIVNQSELGGSFITDDRWLAISCK